MHVALTTPLRLIPSTCSRFSRPFALVIACCMPLATTWCAWRVATATPGLDYFAFWSVVQLRRENHPAAQKLYGLANQRRLGAAVAAAMGPAATHTREAVAASTNLKLYDGRIETWATPFLYGALAQLMTGDYERDYHFFVAFSLGSHALAIALMCRGMGYSSTLTGWCIAAFGLAFLPFTSNMVVLNVGALQLLQIAGLLALVRRRAMVAAGFLFGLAILFKPLVAPAAMALGIVMVADGHRRSVAGLVAGLAAGGGIAWLAGCLFLTDWTCWSDWSTGLQNLISSTHLINSSSNCSLSSWARAATGIDASAFITAGLLGCTMLCAYHGRVATSPEQSSESRPFDRLVLATCLGCLIALAGSPLVWPHYQLLCIPLLLWAGRRAISLSEHPAYSSLAALAFLLLSAFGSAMGLGRQATALFLGNVANLLLVLLAFHDLVHAAAEIEDGSAARA